MPALLEIIFKFGIVGLIGLILDFSVTWFCKEKLRFNKFLANGLGFCIAVINNYLLNRIWTFTSNNPKITNQFLLFLMVSLTGLLLNTFIIYLLHNKIHLNFYLSKVIAIALVFIWNFTLNSLFTFNCTTCGI